MLGVPRRAAGVPLMLASVGRGDWILKQQAVSVTTPTRTHERCFPGQWPEYSPDSQS